MELWCKSKQWISTVVLLTSASVRSANVSPDKSGRADVRISPGQRKVLFNDLYILVLFGVRRQKSPAVFTSC